ncbi:hypothetical protein [Parenemella sanctibonifatiensis]|uniref:Uncharacterized protein n=1 Tax=Parenemella sanctibonifatiensis TaxID=2016505 RepID=A0A255E3Z2_9ACTN|nr:hypothetical protein [Parenemella sanctibonifatiensis]OYN84102.1 hypothetical protein CGZ92_13710 [Parenemella sanctibonifatiensis]
MTFLPGWGRLGRRCLAALAAVATVLVTGCTPPSLPFTTGRYFTSLGWPGVAPTGETLAPADLGLNSPSLAIEVSSLATHIAADGIVHVSDPGQGRDLDVVMTGWDNQERWRSTIPAPADREGLSLRTSVDSGLGVVGLWWGVGAPDEDLWTELVGDVTFFELASGRRGTITPDPASGDIALGSEDLVGYISGPADEDILTFMAHLDAELRLVESWGEAYPSDSTILGAVGGEPVWSRLQPGDHEWIFIGEKMIAEDISWWAWGGDFFVGEELLDGRRLLVTTRDGSVHAETTGACRLTDRLMVGLGGEVISGNLVHLPGLDRTVCLDRWIPREAEVASVTPDGTVFSVRYNEVYLSRIGEHGVHLTALSDAPVVTPTHLVFVEDSRGTRRITAYAIGDLQLPV